MKLTGKILYKSIYIIIFLLFFIVLTYIFFPYGRLKKPIELSIYNGTGLKTVIKSIGPSFLFGLNLSGVKISGYSGANNRLKPVVTVKSARINNIPLLALDYIFFKGILVNTKLGGVKTYSIEKGFINIPGLSLKTVNIDLYIKNLSKGTLTGGRLSGHIAFSGDLTGSLNIKNAEVEPLFKINNGIFKVKPVKSVYGKFSTLFTTIFKKGKNGYFIYNINNLIL